MSVSSNLVKRFVRESRQYLGKTLKKTNEQEIIELSYQAVLAMVKAIIASRNNPLRGDVYCAFYVTCHLSSEGLIDSYNMKTYRDLVNHVMGSSSTAIVFSLKDIHKLITQLDLIVIDYLEKDLAGCASDEREVLADDCKIT